MILGCTRILAVRKFSLYACWKGIILSGTVVNRNALNYRYSKGIEIDLCKNLLGMRLMLCSFRAV